MSEVKSEEKVEEVKEKENNENTEKEGEENQDDTLWRRMKNFFKSDPETVVNLEDEKQNENDKKDKDKSESELQEDASGVKDNVEVKEVTVTLNAEVKENEEAEVMGNDEEKVQDSGDTKQGANGDNAENGGEPESWSFLERRLIEQHSLRHALPGTIGFSPAEPRRSFDDGPLVRIAEEESESEPPLAEPDEEETSDNRLDAKKTGKQNEEKGVQQNRYNAGKRSLDDSLVGYNKTNGVVVSHRAVESFAYENPSFTDKEDESIDSGNRSSRSIFDYEGVKPLIDDDIDLLAEHQANSPDYKTKEKPSSASSMNTERNPSDSSDDSGKPKSPRKFQVKCTISSVTVVHAPKSTSTSESDENLDDLNDFINENEEEDIEDETDKSEDEDDRIKSRQVPKKQRKVFVASEKKEFNPGDVDFAADDDVFRDRFFLFESERSQDEPSGRAEDEVEETVQPAVAEADVEAETDDIIKMLEEMDKIEESEEAAGESKPEEKPVSSDGEPSTPTRTEETDEAAGETKSEEEPASSDDGPPVPTHTDEEPELPGEVPVEDDFTRLKKWDEEPADWWTNIKKTPVYDIWIKPTKDGTITRAAVPFIDIPYKDVVRLVSDLGYRRLWDKTFSRIEELSSDDDSKILKCTITTLTKRHDLTLATRERHGNEESPTYITTWRRQGRPDVPAKSPTGRRFSKILTFDTRTCGIIVRPAENENNDLGTRLSILCQLTGATDHVIKKTFLAGDPHKFLKDLLKFYEKEKKNQQFKIIKL